MNEETKNQENQETQAQQDRIKELLAKMNSSGNQDIKVEKSSITGKYDVITKDGKTTNIYIDKDGAVFSHGEMAQEIKGSLENGGKIENADSNDNKISDIKQGVINKINQADIPDNIKDQMINQVLNTDVVKDALKIKEQEEKAKDISSKNQDKDKIAQHRGTNKPYESPSVKTTTPQEMTKEATYKEIADKKQSER